MQTFSNNYGDNINFRKISIFDRIISEIESSLSILSGKVESNRSNPSINISDKYLLSDEEKLFISKLMRINHVGEICAQALYRGQAFACKDKVIRDLFIEASIEEIDHLVWCSQRIMELDGRTSVLSPFWYVGSFFLGLMANFQGPSINLGFMSETEKQVEIHLEEHLNLIPYTDSKSRAIIMQMQKDEMHHKEVADRAGADELSNVSKAIMRIMARFMKEITYWL
ncbi:demethoxyubiquinone hydroxylase Coq7 [Candidatus Kinetoplastibacterium blastocrithidii TCC012E]|uniref:3-demethoxyubiquinol 3-hydroxylase n=1 Tax=Candidatus Kinetoplastidibacterium blastocrithidiae TCC012E TaxID=1208922 RepID=M1LZP6_9PROT|nr:2-polyprenyl-3-methyl-6-methoxy-1,4-benzoquinone monooxygenase [Candidatus Kinetoplastibacterium blastocrithidii]AFZ83445.1 ubiquinone biosynthesis monooxygenase Coq7 [Candidatus Kinetoplastibacterium blastocrithidii (ex Strigomonas culicis)]AGF49541.1 demethoxyubiquinone hydroxylase Coq7 [Candidatus Kinetoplastibacterium blastocrithidii TCC012E]